ncbi:unnamed protein product [Rotaria magnacalcarata]|uniref:Uncharacterized protein n=1 Tax=Rotaria magnacalcarata TaxID=392030 RepID=A0A816AN59_9BILA|nr:unnamed protein product [Rotaria magnacalcarata]CAF2055641.1 unnamed protein product [Rotaria magnacalcarata]CAF2086850.1 unnamed protein product [Rotaria magnacalcarata]
MSHSNVTQGMSHADANSEGKPYHEHAEKKVEKEDHPHVQSEKHDAPLSDDKHSIQHHRHDNQYHKDIKGSTGSSTSHPGDHKKDHQ